MLFFYAYIAELITNKLEMVIGNGLVAKAFDVYRSNNRYLIFASGVSDSTNTDSEAFEREQQLLIKCIKEHRDKIFVYFSTCSVYDKALSHTAYVLHKLKMEELIVSFHTQYYIFRISNLVGNSNNPHTIVNFFVRHILSGEFFYLWNNASRNIIDVDDAFLICDHVLQNNRNSNEIINIANTVNYDVKAIVKEIEAFFQINGNYKFVDNDSHPEIDVSAIKGIISALDINFGSNYLKMIINKYYSSNDIQTS